MHGFELGEEVEVFVKGSWETAILVEFKGDKFEVLLYHVNDDVSRIDASIFYARPNGFFCYNIEFLTTDS